MKDAKKKQTYFIKKKEVELKRAKQEAAIIESICEALVSRSGIWNAKQI